MKPKEKKREDLIRDNKALHRKILKLERLGKEQDILNTELSEKTKRLALIEANMLDLISMTDSKGILQYVSPSHKVIWGYEIDELIGRSPLDLVHPDDKPRVTERLNNGVFTDRITETIEFRYRHANGEYYPMECIGSVILDDQGNLQGAIFTSRNLTERKLAEQQRDAVIEALRESEEKYRSITENMTDIVTQMDAQGVITYTSPSHEKIFGDSTQNMVGSSAFDRVHPDDRDQVMAKYMEGVLTKADSEVEYRFRHADGSYIWIRSGGHSFYNSAGELAGIIIISSNINERKQAEFAREAALEALRANEKKYRNITENMSDIVSEIDAQGIFKYTSPSHRKIFGDNAEDMVGTSAFARIHPDDRDRIAFQFREGIRTKADKEVEYRNRHADGHYVWVRSLGNSFFDEAGEFAGSIVTTSDIAERKQAEFAREAALEALRQREAQYRLLSEHMTDSVWLMDMNLKITYFSPSVGKLRGFTAQEISEMSWDQHITPESLKLASELLAEELPKVVADPAYNTIRTLELEYYCKDGSLLLTENKFSIIRDEIGKPVSILGEARDIGERKRVEEKLRESEEFLRETQAIARIGGWKTNPATDFLQWTEEVYRMVEAPLDYQPGLTEGLKYYAPEYIPLIRDLVLNTLINNEPFVKEVEVITSSGKRLWVELRGLAAVTDGQNPSVIGTLQDITSRKQAEEEKRILEERLQHADKMEAIGTLAGGIAHDFNNLLMGIQGYASMTLLNLDTSNPNYERLKRIEQQVQSGADLTSQLLGFARGGRYEVKPTNINEIIEKTSSMFGRTKKEIVINRKTAKDLWNVEVDRGQMEQVFLNLYVNAWQAMPGGGDIYLETQNVLLNDEKVLPFSVKPGKHVKITITDTGTGMDEKTKERIFDPFFTTKEMGRGTGLGLATVYGIIKGHQGMINVYSEPGHGTTFTIYLPATDKEISKEKAPTEEIVTGTETILLIDDEKMVMEVNKELLESMGYKVYAAGSGQEGIAVYMEKRDKIDLIILDMIMPGISGGETFDRLRKINPNIKVLLSSGYSLNGEAKEIMDRGCNGFLQKPFKLEELSGKVREMLG